MVPTASLLGLAVDASMASASLTGQPASGRALLALPWHVIVVLILLGHRVVLPISVASCTNKHCRAALELGPRSLRGYWPSGSSLPVRAPALGACSAA